MQINLAWFRFNATNKHFMTNPSENFYVNDIFLLCRKFYAKTVKGHPKFNWIGASNSNITADELSAFTHAFEYGIVLVFRFTIPTFHVKLPLNNAKGKVSKINGQYEFRGGKQTKQPKTQANLLIENGTTFSERMATNKKKWWKQFFAVKAFIFTRSYRARAHALALVAQMLACQSRMLHKHTFQR